MKNFTLTLTLLIFSLFSTTDILACAWNEVTISPTGSAENPLCPGDGITITICKPGCWPVEENLAAGGNFGIDITDPSGNTSTLNMYYSNLVPGTDDCVSLSYRIPGSGGNFTFSNMSYTNAAGVTTGQVIGEATFYNNGSTVFTGFTPDNDFNMTTQGGSILTSAVDNGLVHEWTVNGELTDCVDPLCAFEITEQPAVYTICHTVINEPCSAPESCQSIAVGFMCGKPDGGGISVYNACNGRVYLQSAEFTGTMHRFRYRKLGQSIWSVTTATTQFNKLIGIKPECTRYEIQIQVYCESLGTWSPWSTTKNFTTRADVPKYDYLSAEAYTNFAYLYLNYYPGDAKQFRYRKVGTGSFSYKSTTEHYVATSNNLDPSTVYEYQVRRKCGTSGKWSCFSELKEFKTLAGMTDGSPTMMQGIIEEDVAIEKTAKIVTAPNPSSGRFTLSGDLVKTGNQLIIRDLTGKTVEQKIINDDFNMEFNLQLKAGTYFLTIIDQTTEKISTERLVIQNL